MPLPAAAFASWCNRVTYPGMSFTGPLEDRIAIRELGETYADAAFRSDREGWLDCWAEDCVWVTPFGELRGKSAMAAQWDQIDAQFGMVGFFPMLAALDVSGERARARCYVREIATVREGGLYKVVGRYEDELLRVGGIWRYARREYAALIREAGSALD